MPGAGREDTLSVYDGDGSDVYGRCQTKVAVLLQMRSGPRDGGDTVDLSGLAAFDNARHVEEPEEQDDVALFRSIIRNTNIWRATYRD